MTRAENTQAARRAGRPGQTLDDTMNRQRSLLSNWATGAVAFLFLVANTLACCTVLFLLALVKLVVPLARVRAPLDRALNAVATCWVTGNGVWMRLTQRTEWDIQGSADLDTSRWYIVACNHQSWVDIFVLQRMLNRRVPLLKFFLKRELLYVPVMPCDSTVAMRCDQFAAAASG